MTITAPSEILIPIIRANYKLLHKLVESWYNRQSHPSFTFEEYLALAESSDVFLLLMTDNKKQSKEHWRQYCREQGWLDGNITNKIQAIKYVREQSIIHGVEETSGLADAKRLVELWLKG